MVYVMSSFIRKIKIVNNNGPINLGNCYDLSPFAVSKEYSGAGSFNEANFLNGERIPAEVPSTSVFVPPPESTAFTFGA